MKLKTRLPLLVLPLFLGEAVYADSQVTYQQKCMACHDNGVAGAPKMSDRGAWTARLAERGIEGLYTSALKGRKAMPPKGACFDCSDEQIKRVVDFMVKGN